MPFNNKRNSRDDSSRRGKNNENFKSTRSNDRSKSSNFSTDKRQSKNFGEDHSSQSNEGSDRGPRKRTFQDRDNHRSDRPSFRSNDRSPRDFDKKDGARRPFNKSETDSRRTDNRFGSKDFDKKDRDKRPFNKSEGDRPFRKSETDSRRTDNRFGSKDFDRKDGDKRSFSQSEGDRSFRKSAHTDSRRTDNRFGSKDFDRKDRDKRPFSQSETDSRRRDDRFSSKDFDKKRNVDEPREGDQDRKFFPKRKFSPAKNPAFGKAKDDGLIRLNRYIANSGICSRRKADQLITEGVITVNGEVTTELGTKVDPAKDDIRYNNERLKREKMVYVLLNKPKDYITTTDDPQERRTVMHLVAKASRERIYPVGRLDRNTTGLLLMTNDGNLAEKLSHPRNNISKIYHAELDKNLTQGDFNKIQFGLELEDGLIKPDDISYVSGGSKREIGIQIHSGKNRIVRRIFEHLGYDVVKLDRVVYGSLTKKDLPRGRWRYLDEKELSQLKQFTK